MKYGPVTYESNLGALGDSILAYAEVYTKKELPEILLDQAAKLSCNALGEGAQGLFQESAATAPSVELLEALPQQQNWRIKRRDKETGVVRPIFTEGYYRITYKRGVRKGQRMVDKRGKYTGKLVGVEGVIPRRERARLWQASGWLSARLGKYASGAASSAGHQGNRAVVTLVLTGPTLSVEITNTSKAALEVAERTGYMARAVVNRIQDLDAYTRRKWEELLDKLNSTQLPAPR